MQVKNIVNLEVENFDKCHMVCDNDCPLGQLYDYSCVLQAFLLGKMNEAKSSQDSQKPVEETPKE